MAETQPVQVPRGFFISGSSLTRIRRLETGNKLTVEYSDFKNENFPVQLKTSGDKLDQVDIPVAVGKILRTKLQQVNIKLDNLGEDGDKHESPRRSSRARTGKSALELLGKREGPQSSTSSKFKTQARLLITALSIIGTDQSKDFRNVSSAHRVSKSPKKGPQPWTGKEDDRQGDKTSVKKNPVAETTSGSLLKGKGVPGETKLMAPIIRGVAVNAATSKSVKIDIPKDLLLYSSKVNPDKEAEASKNGEVPNISKIKTTLNKGLVSNNDQERIDINTEECSKTFKVTKLLPKNTEELQQTITVNDTSINRSKTEKGEVITFKIPKAKDLSTKKMYRVINGQLIEVLNTKTVSVQDKDLHGEMLSSVNSQENDANNSQDLFQQISFSQPGTIKLAKVDGSEKASHPFEIPTKIVSPEATQIKVTPNKAFSPSTLSKEATNERVDGSKVSKVVQYRLPTRGGKVIKPLTSEELEREGDHLGRQFVINPKLEKLIDNLQPQDDMSRHVHEIEVPLAASDEFGNRSRIRYRCKYCERIMASKHDYRKHIRSHPEVDHRPWKCPLCDYSSAIKSAIRKHINVHSEVKAFKCSECGRGFNFKQKLHQHMKYHRDIRDFYCPQCPLSFHELKTLKNHIHKLHNVDNPSAYLKTVKYKEPTQKHIDYREKHRQAQRSDQKRKMLNENVFYVDYTDPPHDPQSNEQLESEEMQIQMLQSVESACIKPVIQLVDDSLTSTTIQDLDTSATVTQIETSADPNLSLEPEEGLETTGCDLQSEDGGTNVEGEGEQYYEVAVEDDMLDRSGPEQQTSVDEVQSTFDKINEFASAQPSEKYSSFIVETKNGPISIKMYHNTEEASSAVMDGGVELVEEAVPASVHEAVDAVQSIEVQPTLSNDPPLYSGTDTQTTLIKAASQATQSTYQAEVIPKSRLVGTRKMNADTERFKQGFTPKDHVGRKRKLGEIEESDHLDFGSAANHAKMKKVTCMAQVEIGVRPYVRIDEMFGSVTFVCLTCEANQQDMPPFDLYTKFLNHLFLEHPNIKPFACQICPHKCRSKANLISHSKIHTDEKKHKCSICGKCFYYKQKLTVHMRVHENLREHVCSLCQHGFNEKADLNRHFRKVHMRERTVSCLECGKKFFDQTDLRRHEQSHSETKTYQCKYCQKYYQTKISLSQHMKSHTCIFHCEICSRDFGSYSGFMAHKVMHDESSEGYLCELCDKKIMTKGSMKRHMQICHNEDRPYTCHHCNKSYKSKKDLKSHQIVHGADQIYACQMCSFTSKRMESLRVHMRRHEAVKPFQCGVCHRQYTQKSALEMHMAIHLARTFQCELCPQEFNSRPLLKSHMHTAHDKDLDELTDDRVLKCDLCTRQFYDSEQLNKHMLDTHVPEELREEVAASGSMTVYMCEECHCACVSQDALALHILEQHMSGSKTIKTEDGADNVGLPQGERQQYSITPVSSKVDETNMNISTEDVQESLGIETNEVECEVITDTTEIASDEAVSSVSQINFFESGSSENIQNQQIIQWEAQERNQEKEKADSITIKIERNEDAPDENIHRNDSDDSLDSSNKSLQPVLTYMLKQGPDQT